MQISLAALNNGKIACEQRCRASVQGRRDGRRIRNFRRPPRKQDEEMALYARANVGWAHESTAEPLPSVTEHISELYAKASIT